MNNPLFYDSKVFKYFKSPKISFKILKTKPETI